MICKNDATAYKYLGDHDGEVDPTHFISSVWAANKITIYDHEVGIKQDAKLICKFKPVVDLCFEWPNKANVVKDEG